MCGLGGILSLDGTPIDEAWLDVIDARIAPRGPDGSGRFRDRVERDGSVIEVALVHRRLSIIDHADGGQPMVLGAEDDDDRLAVVFNGCIYNHRELRRDLESAGHVFATDHSDTEVLLHGYRAWGAELAEHLEGMYAFALWDRAGGQVVLARDWFGEKPLFVRKGIDGRRVIAFGSDARALADLGGDLPAAGSSAVTLWTGAYLQLGYNWEGRTVYATDDADAVTSAPPTIRTIHETIMPKRPVGRASQAEIEGLLDRAVARRLEADVPLGCFLSGGVDSSLIARFALEHRPDLRTFSVRMPDPRYDESAYAEEAAEHLGTNHTTLEVAPDPAADLVHLIERLGQPFGDSSILPTYWVSRAARDHVTVALSGDGGDELFIGYERYLAARALVRHRRVLRWIPKRWHGRGHPKSKRHRLARLGAMARDLPKLGILAMESLFTQDQVRALTGVDAPAPEAMWGLDAQQALRRADLTNYLPDDLLCKVDTASMAVALEVRAPFLDRDLVRAVLALPPGDLTEGGRKRKGLLRAIARRYLPPRFVDRPKMGFAIPIGALFRDDYGGLRGLLEDHLDAPAPFGPIRLERGAVRSLVDEHLDGTREHGQRLFALLTLAIWARSRA